MTREEAITLRMEIWSGSVEWKREMATRDVDNFASLGMIKLDEPKTIAARISDAMAQITDQSPPGAVRLAFEDAGLKIVEK